MSSSPRRSAFAYSVAFASMFVAVLLRWLLDPALGDALPLTTLFAAIGVAVWFGGYVPAALVAVLGYLACAFLFIQPRGEFGLNELRNVVGLFLFLATAAVIIGFGEGLRRALQRCQTAEEDARGQAERLRTTLASIGDGVIATDPAGCVTSMNAVAEALTGWKNADATGVPLTEVFRIVNESTRQEVENPALRAMKDGVIVGLANHTMLIGRDGTERPIDDSAAPIRSSRGDVVGSVLVFRDISERHRAEVEHKRAQEHITSTLESVTDGFIRYDRDWRIVYVNAEAERINRLSRAEMLGRNVWELFPTLVGTRLETEFRRAIAQRVTVEFENYYEPFARWYALKGFPTDDGGLTAYIRDITEQKRVEQRLMQSEARYRAIGESIDYGVWVCDAEGRNTYASESFLQMVGLTQQQCSEFGWADVLHPDDAEATIAAWKTCVQTRGRWERVHRFKGVDGQWHHVLARGVALQDSNGQNLGWAGINLDISRIVASEQEIVRLAAESERQRRLYETVLTNTPDFVYVFSLDHKVVYANDALIKMWGRGYEGAIGKTFLEIGYEPWHAQMHDREIDQVRATRQPIRGEVPFNGTDGRREYDYIFVPVIGADGEVEAVAGTTRDVTERKAAEERLRASEQRQAFLVKLADTLRPLSDATTVQAEASRVLGEWLRANRVVYFEIRGDDYVIERDYTRGVRPLAGRYPVASFGQSLLTILLEGRTVIEADATTEPDRPADERAAFAALEVRAHVDVPLVKDGRFVAGMTVQVSEPRAWTQQEIAIIEETAERTWAAVARVRAEAALRASEESRRLALDAAELGTFNIDPTSSALTSDERFRMIFSGATDAMDYEEAFAAVHPDDRERIREAVAAATRIENPAAYNQEYRVVHPDGSVRWVFAKGRAKFAGEGSGRRLVSFDGTVADITARKEAEVRAQESEQRFRLVADAAPVMIWLSGADKRVNWYNQPWLDFTGRSMEDEISNGAVDLVHPDDLDLCRKTYTSAFEARLRFSMEYRLRRHDGEFRWMSSNGVPRYRTDGEFEGYIGSCLDVTDYKNAVAGLRDVDRRKDEFLATLAHELRNPLAPIRNGLQVIRLAGATGTIEQARAMMERQLGHMVRLVDDLLDVSRVTSGKLALRTERVDLRAVIDAAVETTRPVIEQAGHQLTVVVPDEPIFVDGDATRLAQVVSNLLDNSAKYTAPHGHIRLRVASESDMAVLVVTDDGIGIPSNMLGKVFDMFTQVDRTLEKATGGLGIGLSLVKGLVEMHGGTIEVHSEGEGQGSEFIVRLPWRASAAPRAPAPTSSVEPAGVARRRRILVADDNADAAESLRQLLELLGNDVTAANDGLQAVEAAEKFRPDLVLLDIGMPKLNGYEACRRIREQAWGKSAIVVALTGWGQDDDRQRSLETGFDHHLVKPVDPATLEMLLSSLKAAPP